MRKKLLRNQTWSGQGPNSRTRFQLGSRLAPNFRTWFQPCSVPKNRTGYIVSLTHSLTREFANDDNQSRTSAGKKENLE